MSELKKLKIKIYADGADLQVIGEMAKDPRIRGFTTNPTLMRKSGVTNYEEFAKKVLRIVPDRPISFEVFSDDFAEMEDQAMEIASWGKNVYVKIPVSDTQGVFSGTLIKQLSSAGVQVNVTALMTVQQVEKVLKCLSPKTSSVISVFAGRVADTGRDPVPLMAEAVQLLKANLKAELIWASPRELLNIFQADAIGCHIITATHEILNKLSLLGKNLDSFSLETVKMFRTDAVFAKFDIKIKHKEGIRS